MKKLNRTNGVPLSVKPSSGNRHGKPKLEKHEDRWIVPGQRPPPPPVGAKAFGGRHESGDVIKRLQLHLTWDLFRRIKAAAAKMDVSMSSLVATIVSEWLDRKDMRGE